MYFSKKIQVVVVALMGLLILSLPLMGSVKGQIPSHQTTVEEEWLQELNKPLHPAPNPRPDLRPSGKNRDWQPMIDAVWGPGLPGSEQLSIFMNWVNTLDEEFACFVNHDVDLVELYTPYLGEISAGVSRGRFQAIMSRVCLALQNGHTTFLDTGVTNTLPDRGVPLLVGHSYGPTYFFGACLTMGDEGPFVYEVVADHPLGLEIGDVVLGYDGSPWPEVYQELLDAELPVGRGSWLTSDASFDYGWGTAVGNNWHLFDTIDIMKFSTGEVVHLPTSPMEDASISDLYLFCTDIVDDTVPRPGQPNWVTWDIVDFVEPDTCRIGFIRCDSWSGQAGSKWEEACLDMVADGDLDGLIIDFRTNMGGDMFLSNAGLAHLFNETVPTIDFAERSNPDDHLAMARLGQSWTYDINGNPDTYFEKPIAVLLGPKTISSGDQVALRMTYHPMVETFGMPTSGTFDAPEDYYVTGYSQFSARYSRYNSGLVELPEEYLSSFGVPVDHAVWLEPDDCRNNVDTVVEQAKNWILGGLSAVPGEGPALRRQVVRASPNPFNPRTTFSFEVADPGEVFLDIYDLGGRRVCRLVEENLTAGTHEVTWAGVNDAGQAVSSGVYFARLWMDGTVTLKKVALIK